MFFFSKAEVGERFWPHDTYNMLVYAAHSLTHTKHGMQQKALLFLFHVCTKSTLSGVRLRLMRRKNEHPAEHRDGDGEACTLSFLSAHAICVVLHLSKYTTSCFSDHILQEILRRRTENVPENSRTFRAHARGAERRRKLR